MEPDSKPHRLFVGRAEVVAELHRRLDQIRDGSGRITLLLGDTGVGKTTLVSELVPEMRARGIRVLVGRAPAVDEPPPFALLRSAIESARDDPLLRSDLDPEMSGGAMLIGFAPGFDETTAAKPVGFEARLLDYLGEGEGGGARTREQFLTDLAGRFLELTRHGPTVLVLEDLDHADGSSLAAIEFFQQELEGRPLWILATARPPEALSSTGRERIERFERTTRAERLALRPLTSSETEEYLRRGHPSGELSRDEIERRFSETGGNPYLLGQFDRRPGRDEADERSAGDPRDEAAQQVLDLAAVLGPEFPFALLLKASEEDEERLAEEVDRLVGAGVLFERPGELLEFPQDRLREEVYNYLSERRRRLLHRRAGAALEAMGRADSARVYALARHFYLGREGQKAVQYNRIAAEIAERALAPEVAWEHFTHALESHRQATPEDLDGEAELVLGLARITEELGVLRESEEALREFLGRTRDDPRLSTTRRAALEVFLCRVLAAEGDLPATAELAQKVLSTPGLDDQLLVLLGASHHLGMVAYYEGRYADALAHHTGEIALARRVANPQILARAQIWRVASLQMLGRVDEAIAEAREVTAARDRLGSVRESAMAHLVLGDILADARSPPEARKQALEEYATTIRFAEQAKDPRRIGWAMYKSSELLREEGRFPEASELAERACHILEEVGDQTGLAVSLRARGRIALDRGELDRAERDFAEAYRLLQGTSNALEEIDTVLRLGQLALARGDRPEALRRVADLGERKLSQRRPDLRGELESLERALLGNPSVPAKGPA